MKLFSLLYCKRRVDVSNNLLTLKSARIGFPSADFFFFDNACIPEFRQEAQKLAAAIGAKYLVLPQECFPWDWLHEILLGNQVMAEAIGILDPDLMFWRNCEALFQSDALARGRLIPTFYDSEYTKTVTMERLHPSLFLVPTLSRFRATVLPLIKKHRAEFMPFRPITIPTSPHPLRYDTGALFYSACKAECSVFSEEENKWFDHLFCGSHINLVPIPSLRHLHKQVAENPAHLRGQWPRQLAYFTERQVSAPYCIF